MINKYIPGEISVDKFTGGEPFFMAPLRLLSDKRLDGNSFKVLSYMISRYEDWKFNTYDICNFIGLSKDVVRSRLNILEKLGYLIRTKVRSAAGKIISTNYIVSHSSLVDKTCGYPVDNSAGDNNRNLSIVLEPRAANQGVILPGLGYPGLDEPGLDNPGLENPTYTYIENTNMDLNNIDFTKIGETVLLQPSVSVRDLSENINAIADDFKKSGDGNELVAIQLNNKLKNKISVADLRLHIERYGVEMVSETALTLIEKGILNKGSPGGYLNSVLIKGGVKQQSPNHEPKNDLKRESEVPWKLASDVTETIEPKYTLAWWHSLDDSQKTIVFEKCLVPFPMLENHVKFCKLDILSPDFGNVDSASPWVFRDMAKVCESYFKNTRPEDILVRKVDNSSKITNQMNGGNKLNAPFVRPVADVIADLKYIEEIYDPV